MIAAAPQLSQDPNISGFSQKVLFYPLLPALHSGHSCLPLPSSHEVPNVLGGSHDASGTLGLAPATGLIVWLDNGLHSILKDAAHCPSHHVGTPIPVGTTLPGPKDQRHKPQWAQRLKEGQKMKGS